MLTVAASETAPIPLKVLNVDDRFLNFGPGKKVLEIAHRICKLLFYWQLQGQLRGA